MMKGQEELDERMFLKGGSESPVVFWPCNLHEEWLARSWFKIEIAYIRTSARTADQETQKASTRHQLQRLA